MHLVEAVLTRNTEVVGKMDPYVKMKCCENEWRSTILNEGGKNPVWQGQYFDITVKYLSDDVIFEVRDEDVSDSDLVGKGIIKLSSLIVNGQGIDEWFEIQCQGKSTGKVHFRCEW